MVERCNSDPYFRAKRSLVTVARCSFALMIVYFLLHLLTVNTDCGIVLPFDGSVITLFAFGVLLLVLIQLLPFIKGLSMGGFGMDVDND